MQVMVKRKNTTNELFHSDTYLGEIYDDGLMHFKYVHKEKKNGKWHYYYYHKEGSNTAAIYEKTSGDPNSKYGIYKHGGGSDGNFYGRTVNVVKSNKLFSSRARSAENTGGGYYETRHIGKLERNYDYVSDKISKWSKKTAKQAKKSINKGKSWLSKLLKIS